MKKSSNQKTPLPVIVLAHVVFWPIVILLTVITVPMLSLFIGAAIEIGYDVSYKLWSNLHTPCLLLIGAVSGQILIALFKWSESKIYGKKEDS